MEKRFVIIRAEKAGAHFGELVSSVPMSGGFSVVLKNSRRIWSWAGGNCLSDLAINGSRLPQECKVSQPLPQNEMFAIEIIQTTEEGEKRLKSIPEWTFQAK